MKNFGTTDNTIVQVFSDLAMNSGRIRRKPEGLMVSYFRTEFNRCLEHRELNRIVRSPIKSGRIGRWFEIAPVCRINDMRKVESGRHLTVFEVLASVSDHLPEKLKEAREELTVEIIDFLIKKLELDKRRMRITYFGGGEVIPGEIINADEDWCRTWIKAGIPATGLVPVRGPKNFLLFAADEERCGPKCEIFYEIDSKNGPFWIEIATVIIDTSLIKRHKDDAWEIQVAPSALTGVAYGLERLLGACLNASHFAELPGWDKLLNLIIDSSGQDEEAKDSMRGDMVTLIDQVRACTFLVGFGVRADTSEWGRLLSVMARRVRRKIALLAIENWRKVVFDLEQIFTDMYVDRYPSLRTTLGESTNLINQVSWPTGWNPESYAPTENAE